MPCTIADKCSRCALTASGRRSSCGRPARCFLGGGPAERPGGQLRWARGGTNLMHERKIEAAPVALLWTGGWDSTFRLLMLLLVERRAVQSYYIVDRLRYR